MLRAVDVTKRFDQFVALSSITLDLLAGDVIGLVGPSGAGKTLLLRLLAGLDRVSSGSIYSQHSFGDSGDNLLPVNTIESTMSPAPGSIGYVFQDLQLWPHKTIRANITLAPLLTRSCSTQQARVMAATLAAKLGIQDQLDKLPFQLSIGQQQRAAIARTLAMKPSVLLFDEITSALDRVTAASISRLIGDLRSDNTCIVIISHDIALLNNICNRFIVIQGGTILADAATLSVEHLGVNVRSILALD